VYSFTFKLSIKTEMKKNIKLFNPYATSSLKYANEISLHENKKTIWW
jgi:hypothetical protein